MGTGYLIGKLWEMLGVMVMDNHWCEGFPSKMFSLTWHSFWLSILFQRHKLHCKIAVTNDFVAFHDMLLSRFPYRLIPTLPPKKLMGGMFRNRFNIFHVLGTGVKVWQNKFPVLFKVLQKFDGFFIPELDRKQTVKLLFISLKFKCDLLISSLLSSSLFQQLVLAPVES